MLYLQGRASQPIVIMSEAASHRQSMKLPSQWWVRLACLGGLIVGMGKSGGNRYSIRYINDTAQLVRGDDTNLVSCAAAQSTYDSLDDSLDFGHGGGRGDTQRWWQTSMKLRYLYSWKIGKWNTPLTVSGSVSLMAACRGSASDPGAVRLEACWYNFSVFRKASIFSRNGH